MKSIFKSFFRKLFGLDSGAKLARLPFILAHVLGYAIVFFLLQLIKFSAQGVEGLVSMNQFTFALLVFAITIVLFPIHIRRAHDLGWSMRIPFYFSVLPAFLRIVCLLVPLVALFNPALIASLFKIMPFIGIAFWGLNQIQLVFMVVLFFAPGIGTHNRYSGESAKVFNFENLYGFKLIKKLANNVSPR